MGRCRAVGNGSHLDDADGYGTGGRVLACLDEGGGGRRPVRVGHSVPALGVDVENAGVDFVGRAQLDDGALILRRNRLKYPVVERLASCPSDDRRQKEVHEIDAAGLRHTGRFDAECLGCRVSLGRNDSGRGADAHADHEHQHEDDGTPQGNHPSGALRRGTASAATGPRLRGQRFRWSTGPVGASVERPLRCLWLSGHDPRGPDSGLLCYSDGLTRAAGNAGIVVVGLGLWRDALSSKDGRVLWHPVHSKRRAPLVGLLTHLPNMAASFATKAYRRRLEDALREPWDVVVIDHLQMGWAIGRVRSARASGRIACVVHVSHNHETSVRQRATTQPGTSRLLRPILRLDAFKARRLEHAVLKAADVVTCITEEDRGRFASGGARGRLIVIPPGYDGRVDDARRIGADVPRRAVVLGNTTWAVKRKNLLSFLLVADPVFEAAGVELVVAGPTPEDFVVAMQHRLRATRFLGEVNDVSEVLRTSRVGIVAEPVGGGFKMKTLDYVFNRVPIAAMEGSVVGMPLEVGTEILSFASGDDLAHGVVDVIDDLPVLNALQERAFARCLDLFDWSERGQRLMRELVACRDGGDP